VRVRFITQEATEIVAEEIDVSQDMLSCKNRFNLKKTKKMKKEYIIGGLALVGVIALFAWYSKPKKNKEGFYGASGCGCGVK